MGAKISFAFVSYRRVFDFCDCNVVDVKAVVSDGSSRPFCVRTVRVVRGGAAKRGTEDGNVERTALWI